MISKELLKKVGILGASFGLIISPLAFAEAEGEATEPSHEEILDESDTQSTDGNTDQDDPNQTEEEDDKSSTP